MSYCTPQTRCTPQIRAKKKGQRRMKDRINIRVPDGERTEIEHIIKREYPKLKTVSDVVRLALTDFLAKQQES
jgi:hypothetical protein